MRRWLGTLLTVTALLLAPLGAADANAAGRQAPASKAPRVQRLSSYFGLPDGGQTVTITGSGFKRATSVSFGDVRVTPTVISDSSIKVTVPSHQSATVDVKVTAGSVTSQAVAAGKFVYHYQAPTGAKVTPGTYVPNGPVLCMSGGSCSPIASITSGFTNNVTCQVTNSDYGPLGLIWSQGANQKYGLNVTYSGSMIEITCDGVVGRTNSWPK